MSYKARVSSSSSGQKKPQMKESSTFNWNSIRNLVEREQNGYIKNKLILSCLKGASQTSKQETVFESELLLFKFIEFFSFGKLFPNFVKNYKPSESNGKVSKKDKIRMDNQLMFQENDFKLFALGKSYDIMMTSTYRFTYDVSKYLYIFYWNIEILKGLRDKRPVPPLVILDACLSLNRFIDRSILKNEHYLEGFYNLQTKVNSLMNESFYNLLFKNPKFLVHCSFQNYEGEVKLYQEQQQLIDDITARVLEDRPILLGTSLPTGQGKTFSASCLAKNFPSTLPIKRFSLHVQTSSSTTS